MRTRRVHHVGTFAGVREPLALERGTTGEARQLTRYVSLFVAVALVLALLPATAAVASAAASASLDADSLDTFPGEGQSFTVTVENDESGLFGVGGDAIDWIRVIAPQSRGFTFAEDVDVDGWQAHTTRTQRSQSVTLVDGELGPGDSLDIDLLLDVARPADSDVTGPFQVMVSSDGGATTAEADGQLSSLVRILEVLDSDVVAPTEAADGSATYGQSVDWGVTVANHALNDVVVDAALAPEDFDHEVSPRDGESSIPGGGQATFGFDVTFQDRTDTDRTEQFTASAEADGAEARDLTTELRLEVPTVLRFDPDSFEPAYASPTLDYQFSGEFARDGSPSLTLHGGEAAFTNGNGDSLTADISVDDSDTSWPVDGATGEIVTATTRPDVADGDYDVAYELDVVDGNGYAYLLEADGSDVLTVDGLLPDITNLEVVLPEDEDGDRQVRAKDGDTIEISGEVHDRIPDPDGVSLTLEIDGADDIEVPAEDIDTQETAEGLEFEATIEPEFGVDDSEFTVRVEAADLAGNVGTDASDALEIDNIVPELRPQGFMREGGQFDDQPVIWVRFSENYTIKGGCNTGLYEVDGGLLDVADVYYANGEPCEPGQPSPDESNVRVLTLVNERDRDEETTVRYEPEGPFGDRSDRIKDGAGHFAAQGVQDIISEVAPPLPEIEEVTRNDGEETAVFDEDRYWTRVGGNDLEVTIQGGEVRRGDTLEVLNAEGSVIGESDAAGENGEALSATVPLGSDEGTYERLLRLRSAQGIAGEAEEILVELDQTRPVIDAAQRLGDSDEVEVTFSELLWSGRNAAQDWRAYQDDDGGLAEVGVRSVSSSDEVITLEVAFNDDDFGHFAGVEYLSFGGEGDRYVDRAGNRVADEFFDSR